MHVLLIIRGFELDGPGRLVYSILRAFRKDDLKVSVVALSSRGELKSSIQREVRRLGGGFKIVLTPWPRVSSSVKIIVNYAMKIGATHLQAHLLRPDVVGRKVARATKLPYVYTEHGLHAWKDKGPFFKPFLRFWYLRTFPRLGRIVAVSSKVEGQLRREGFPSSKVALIPNGVDLKYFHPTTIDGKRRARRELGLKSKGGPIISVVGGLTKNKRGALAVKMMRMLRAFDSAPNATLLFVGEGKRKAFLAKLARKHGVRKQVRFLGERGDPRAAYWASDILLHPSIQESFGLAVAEAAACGLPSLVRAGSGADAIAPAWPWSLAIEGDRPQDWAQGLVTLLKANSVGEVDMDDLREEIRATLNIQNTASMYIDLYRGFQSTK